MKPTARLMTEHVTGETTRNAVSLGPSAIQEAIGFEDEVIVILVEGSMIGIGVQNELRVRHILYQMK
jgi:hypothetical protein